MPNRNVGSRPPRSSKFADSEHQNGAETSPLRRRLRQLYMAQSSGAPGSQGTAQDTNELEIGAFPDNIEDWQPENWLNEDLRTAGLSDLASSAGTIAASRPLHPAGRPTARPFLRPGSSPEISRAEGLTQEDAPLKDALEWYRESRIVPFDVPGHKQGRGNPDLTEFLGQRTMSIDVNSMPALDNLIHPTGVIRDAEILAAQAFGAAASFFMVNGTSAAVQAMVMTCCGEGDKIIMPRNVHRSSINSLILSGAIPVYVNPDTDNRLGIPLGMAVADVRAAIERHPDAKAVLVNNPTYYGVCPNLPAIVSLAHANDMKVLCDEAHGTHLYFGDNLPINAITAGADMASVSVHKTGGSLTQSSLLLLGDDISPGLTRQVINLTQTTSASYLLMASLDIARRNLALHGREIFARVTQYAQYAREQVNEIGGYYAIGSEICNGDSFYSFDTTKLTVHTRAIGLTGIEVADKLRLDYGIQVEFGDTGNFLAIISVGDRPRDLERLISALTEIRRGADGDPADMLFHEYIEPQMVVPPRQAYYTNKRTVPLDQALNEVAGEFVMCYPPGIPILAPGERITSDALDYIEYSRARGSKMVGTADLEVRNIQVLTDK